MPTTATAITATTKTCTATTTAANAITATTKTCTTATTTSATEAADQLPLGVL